VDEPNLYSLLSEVLLGDNVVDAEKTTFGVRSISVDARRFPSERHTIEAKGGCIHHDHGHSAPPATTAEQRKIELSNPAGYNALRTAHNPPAPALLNACDRLGFLVIDKL
jgi:beta-galactosidase